MSAYKGPGRDLLTPLNIPQLKAWWSFRPGNMWAEQAGTRVTPVTTNVAVGEVGDLSGNGYHMLAGASGKRPVYSGAHKWAVFDGSDDYMTHASVFSANSTFTVVWRGQLGADN